MSAHVPVVRIITFCNSLEGQGKTFEKRKLLDLFYTLQNKSINYNEESFFGVVCLFVCVCVCVSVTAITHQEIRIGARKYVFGHEEEVYLNAV
jgi:hypothetical protein